MRIIGGELKGRILSFPARSKERPTSDFLRETLFNLLGSMQGKIFLDLFAGSGGVGLEAASRGAREAFLIEKNKDLIEVIKNNIQICSLEQKCRVIAGDVEYGLQVLFKKKYEFDIIFADPPYSRNLAVTTLMSLNKYRVLKEGGVVVIQHSTRKNFREFLGENIHQTDQRKYGDNALTFFRME